jgi:hypothetical protein
LKNNLRESSSAEVEITEYLNEPNLQITHNVAEWWHSKSTYYPSLYKLALNYLIIPATSASSERVFSIAGYIMNGKRNRLSSNHLNISVFLHSKTQSSYKKASL